ncbi:MAG: hypothetical protein VB949_05505 [Pseudomonadales bacterium]|jgi:hypothetical protein
MASLLVVIAVCLVVLVWVRGARRNRERWLQRLDLPGIWRCDNEHGSLELSGELQSGTYRFREPDADEQGTWVLEGRMLILTSRLDESPRPYELRFFDSGKIGLDGPGRARRVYVKEPNNVVPLRRRS